ncbi:hypothetical protein BRCON_1192 [Candidatus Sumerlaea chitinivorans]|uniref:Uncharacterized protein n=1 Tax=Sumerlaea chitinivorans TaxID=2250252 RepID=A0A2Z4Y4Q6_SUMC1|nr:hypothetical protein BRCON_1192 [Candidatus Sumerlaea chitinivorans]
MSGVKTQGHLSCWGKHLQERGKSERHGFNQERDVQHRGEGCTRTSGGKANRQQKRKERTGARGALLHSTTFQLKSLVNRPIAHSRIWQKVWPTAGRSERNVIEVIGDRSSWCSLIPEEAAKGACWVQRPIANHPCYDRVRQDIALHDFPPCKAQGIIRSKALVRGSTISSSIFTHVEGQLVTSARRINCKANIRFARVIYGGRVVVQTCRRLDTHKSTRRTGPFPSQLAGFHARFCLLIRVLVDLSVRVGVDTTRRSTKARTPVGDKIGACRSCLKILQNRVSIYTGGQCDDCSYCHECTSHFP